METLVVALTILVLAVFVGFEVIAKVPPLLHTPPDVRLQRPIRDYPCGSGCGGGL